MSGRGMSGGNMSGENMSTKKCPDPLTTTTSAWGKGCDYFRAVFFTTEPLLAKLRYGAKMLRRSSTL